jgi:hypothetical protein
MGMARLVSVLVINAGSSTLKLKVVADDDRIEAELDVDPWYGVSAGAHINASGLKPVPPKFNLLLVRHTR